MGFRFQKIWLLLFVVVFAAVANDAAAAGKNFVKLDSQGQELPADAAEWAIVLETGSGMYWEIKTTDDSIHSNKAAYNFAEVEEKFISKLNEENFGGFSDWRLPTTSEMPIIRQRKKNAEAQVDLNYFPNTIPSKYMTQGWCGSRSEYQEESFKFGKQKIKGVRYVMAVRGQPLE